jgi:hypothetical protein
VETRWWMDGSTLFKFSVSWNVQSVSFSQRGRYSHVHNENCQQQNLYSNATVVCDDHTKQVKTWNLRQMDHLVSYLISIETWLRSSWCSIYTLSVKKMANDMSELTGKLDQLLRVVSCVISTFERIDKRLSVVESQLGHLSALETQLTNIQNQLTRHSEETTESFRMINERRVRSD